MTAKKHPSVRARRNKASTAATLPAEKPRLVAVEDYDAMTLPQLRAELKERGLPTRGAKPVLVAALLESDDDSPKLPDRNEGWHPLTEAWWTDVWSSPMSAEWHESDLHNVYVCALLYDDMWRGETATARAKAAAEFRQQRASLGLTPYDRRRLEWTIESAEEAKDRGQQRRRTPKPPVGGAAKRRDPRAGLHAVN